MLTSAQASKQSSEKVLSTGNMTLIAVMTACTCILAPLSIPLPFSPVPLTLTNLVIMVTAYLLGPRLAGISCLLYLLLGIAGLPVFSAYGSGIAKVIGPTGGYLVGFLPLSPAAGAIFEYMEKPVLRIALLAAATLFLLYLPGTAWLAFQAGLTFSQALFMGVIPYIPGDILKIILAVVLGPVLSRSLHRAGVLQ